MNGELFQPLINEWGLVSKVIWPTEKKRAVRWCTVQWSWVGTQGGPEGKPSGLCPRRLMGRLGVGPAAQAGMEPNLGLLCFSRWYKWQKTTEKETNLCDWRLECLFSKKQEDSVDTWMLKLEMEQITSTTKISKGNSLKKKRKCAFKQKRTKG